MRDDESLRCIASGSARRLPFEISAVRCTIVRERLSWRGAITWHLACRVMRWREVVRSRPRVAPLVQCALQAEEARNKAQQKDCDEEGHTEDDLPRSRCLLDPSLRAIAADRPRSLHHASRDHRQRWHAIAAGTRPLRRLSTAERGLSARHIALPTPRCREAKVMRRTIYSTPPRRAFSSAAR